MGSVELVSRQVAEFATILRQNAYKRKVVPKMKILPTGQQRRDAGRSIRPSQLTTLVLLCVCLVANAGCASLPGKTDAGDLPFEATAEESEDQPAQPKTFAERQAQLREFFHARFGESAGIDPRAREIEKRLGF